jgi:hypothetical protein
MSAPRDEGQEPHSRRGAVIALVLLLALVAAGYFLMTALRRNGDLEDCLMAGRRNCGPVIETRPRGRLAGPAAIRAARAGSG